MRISEKRKLVELLQNDDFEMILSALQRLPPKKVVNPLFAALCNSSEKVRWHAITAMGPIVSSIADQNMEQARIIMRRFMWSLNDESGGIGWGAPESMAEVLATNDGLAAEYCHIPVSYMREDGNYLELEMLQRGLLWGIARLARVRPDLMLKWQAPRYLEPYLNTDDPQIRGLAVLALGFLNYDPVLNKLQKLIDDTSPVRLYWDGEFSSPTVGDLAARAITIIS